LLSQLSGFAFHYGAQPITAKVVDADTGQPWRGIVVAHWILKFGLKGSSGMDMKLTESVTDRDGQFFFPA
jgi:hypothetical protein